MSLREMMRVELHIPTVLEEAIGEREEERARVGIYLHTQVLSGGACGRL